jgi:hypothetical protein
MPSMTVSRRGAPLAAAVALALAAAACGKSKAEECSALVTRMNTANAAYSSAPDPRNDAEARSLADILKKNAVDLGAVDLKDPQLKGFRDTFVKSANDSAAALIAIADLPGDATPADFKSRADQWKTGIDGLAKLPDAINGYCK